VKIGILGTGRVANTLAGGLAAAGHALTLGSRRPEAVQDSPFAVAGQEEAVRTSELVINATPGRVSVEVVEAIGADTFAGKVLLDVANAVTADFDLVYPNRSVAQALQEALPDARVVKSLNTMPAPLMIAPPTIPLSTIFVSGDDAEARATVAGLLEDLGWTTEAILDLGGIESARGPEHYFLLFLAVRQAIGTPLFNIHIVRHEDSL
jgi:8-hydroxy-5-deazaflavin:NADPH oxidoreductase